MRIMFDIRQYFRVNFLFVPGQRRYSDANPEQITDHGSSGCGSPGFSGLLPLVRRGMWCEFWVAEFDLAAAVQEDAEDDVGRVGRDLGDDLMPGPVAVSGDEGEVVGGIVPGILSGWSLWRGPFFAGAEHQAGEAGDVGGAQFAAERDRATAVVVGEDPLAEEGESGGLRHGRGQDHSPVFGGAGIVEPGALTQEGAAELPSVQLVG
jgi:hypothetical protein